MSEHENGITRRNLLIGAGVAGAALLATPFLGLGKPAFAETAAEAQAKADAVRADLISLQADLEAASNAYYAALEELTAANLSIEECNANIAAATARIAELQEHLSTRVRSMYRTGPTAFVDFLLGSSSFADFVNNWNILDRMNEADSAAVKETKQLNEQLEKDKKTLTEQQIVAAQKEQEARIIKEEAETKTNEMQAYVDALDEEARALLEEEQAAEARRQAASYGGGTSYTPSYDYVDVGGPYTDVVSAALSRIGCPYVWGGSGPYEFDCSGLVQWAYAQCGMYVPHQSESLYACATNIVPVSEARPGDVLYRYGHVGIAVGYGGVPYVHAPTFGAYVRDTDPLSWSGFTAALQF